MNFNTINVWLNFGGDEWTDLDDLDVSIGYEDIQDLEKIEADTEYTELDAILKKVLGSFTTIKEFKIQEFEKIVDMINELQYEDIETLMKLVAYQEEHGINNIDDLNLALSSDSFVIYPHMTEEEYIIYQSMDLFNTPDDLSQFVDWLRYAEYNGIAANECQLGSITFVYNVY